MFEKGLDIQQDFRQEIALDDARLDFKRPKETLAVIKINISSGGLRRSIERERVDPLFEWCKNKGIEPESIVALTKVLGKKEPSRDSIHIYLKGSEVKKLGEETIRALNRELKESGFKLFAIKLIKANGKDHLLLYLKNKSEYLLGLKPIDNLCNQPKKVLRHKLENELKKTFRGEGMRFELAI